MKQVLFKLKRRVVLFKETAQMILNQAEFSEVKPWLDLLSAEMDTDFATEWKLQKFGTDLADRQAFFEKRNPAHRQCVTGDVQREPAAGHSR